MGPLWPPLVLQVLEIGEHYSGVRMRLKWRPGLVWRDFG
ncbi:hypothetical protein HU200_002689 [Digitaria exilis]|uniref:Uncharacterized protein n=1 Tax=Digitaria exilis TaxID=1010633 RepID=A0A835FVD1_9POAL|nr:hypothetical protein HU200_002689 [Digitaria exilis]